MKVNIIPIKRFKLNSLNELFLFLAGSDQKRLLLKLFENYDPLERPSSKDSESLKVEVGISMQSIVDVDEKKQTIISNGWLDMVGI